MMRALALGLAIAVSIAAAALGSGQNPSDAVLARWVFECSFAGGAPLVRFGSETFTAAGQHYAPPGWLGTMLSGVLAGGGPGAVRLWSAATCALYLCALAWLLRREPFALRFSAIALSALAAIGSWQDATLGLQLLSVLAFVTLLWRRDGRLGYAAVAVALFWVNLSASGVLAPALAAAVLAGAVPDRAAVTRAAIVTLLCVATLFCTPGGLAFVLALPVFLGFGAATIVSVFAARPAAFASAFLPALVLLAWIGARPRNAPLAAVAIVAALSSVVLFPCAVVVLVLVVADAFREYRPPAWVPRWVRAGAPPAIAAACAIAALAWMPHPPAGDHRAGDLIDRVVDDGAKRIYCSVPAWCNQALTRRGTAVFADGRIDAYPAPIRRDQQSIASVRKGWPQLLERWNVDAVVTADDRALAWLLSADDRWKRLAIDGGLTAFVRRS